MTYAASHETQQILHRSVRPRMGLSQASPPCFEEARTGASKDTQPPRYPGRYLLRLEEWLPLAAFATLLPAVEDRLPLVQEVAHRRDLRAAKHGAARVLASTAGKKSTAQCGDSRFSVSQDERGRWRSTGLRRRQILPANSALLFPLFPGINALETVWKIVGWA